MKRYIAISAFVAAIDLKIKKWIKNQLSESFPMSIAKGNIEIKRSYNRGLAFNTLKNKENLPFIISLGAYFFLIIISFIIFMVKKPPHLFKIGIALILGGATSNIVDRFKNGYVIDYITFTKARPKKIKNIVYNIGDFAIFLGAILTFISYLRVKKVK